MNIPAVIESNKIIIKINVHLYLISFTQAEIGFDDVTLETGLLDTNGRQDFFIFTQHPVLFTTLWKTLCLNLENAPLFQVVHLLQQQRHIVAKLLKFRHTHLNKKTNINWHHTDKPHIFIHTFELNKKKKISLEWRGQRAT